MRNYFFLLNIIRRFSYGLPGLRVPIKESLFLINLAIATSLVFSPPSFIPYVYAGPAGGNVVGGAGSITQSGLMTTVNQTTGSMAINWDSYNVNSNERVKYIQPDSSSLSLNRILSHNGSQIHGRIDANGQVILVNPNGVFFGPTSQINVGGLIASGLDITPTDFMNGNYIFNEVLGTNGTVINNGLINASLGGNVALLGKQVINEGIISAKLGSVSLAAGKEAVLTFDNQGLLGIKITKEILQNELGVDPAVLNSGDITAEGGRILLTASVSQDVFSQAVNSNGIEQATSVVVNDDGTFTLGGGSDVVNTGGIDVSTVINNQDAGQVVLLGENVTSSGVIKADSQNAKGGDVELHSVDTTLLTENSETTARSASNGKGGVVKVLGEKVGLLNSSIVDVSGSTGGGQALIGGGNKGLNKRIRNASRALVASDVNISADSLQVGDGGKIINWSDDTTWFYGSASAKGGEISGNGGFVEISGSSLFFDGFVDTSALHGQVGTLLFDPTNIVIHDKVDNSQPDDIQLPDLSDTTAGSGNFHIGESALEVLGTNSTIILEATNDITINDLADNELGLQLTTGSITFTADSDTSGNGDFQMNAGDTIRTQGGSVTISGSDIVNIGSVNTTGGTGQSGGAINISTTAGDQVITIDGDLISNGGVASVSSAGNAAGIINVTASSSVTVNGNITAIGSDGDATGVNIGGDGGAISVTTAAGTLDVNNSGTISSNGGNGANGGAAGSRDSVSLAAGNINLNGVRDFIANNIDIDSSNRLAITNNLTLDQLSGTSSLSGTIALIIAADITAINSGSSLSFTSSFIRLDTNSNIIVNNGNATFSGTVEILDGANNIVIDTGTGAGNIDFTNAITSNDIGNLSTLSLTAGTGSVTIGGNVGTATNNLKTFSINSATSVDVGEIQTGDGGVTIDADAGNITLRGDVYSDNDTAAGAIDLTGNLILAKSDLRIDSGTDGAGTGNITITGNINSDASDRALIFDADNGDLQVTGSTSVKSLLVEEADSVSFGSINTSRLNRVGGFVNIGSVTDIATSIITGDINTQGLGTAAGVGRGGGDITLKARDITVGTLIARGSNASGIAPLAGGKGGAVVLSADNTSGPKSITLNGDVNTNSGVGVGVATATPGAITMELNGSGRGVLNVNNVFGFTTAFTVTSNTGSIDTINGPDGFSLFGIDSTNSWSIDRANGGILNAKLTFENFENIIGGNYDDSLTFTSAGSISGLIEGGGANIQDTVDVSSLTDVTVEIGNVTNGNINIVDIEQVIANAVGNNTLIADSNNAVNDWNVDRENGGILNSNITFDGFRNLSGGSTDDTFTFTSAGSISGLIDGGGADIQDTVDVSSLTDVTVEIGNVTNGNINIVDIEQVIANAVGNNTLIADSNNAVNDWNIDRANGGILNTNITFNGFRNLSGGSTVDMFNVTPLGSVTGLVSGGAGDDVMTVELTGTQTGILDFDGGVDNDTITLTGGSLTYTGVYSETLADVSFAYADNVNSYTVAYKNTETVRDELQANSLTVNGTGADDIVSLGTDTFVLGSGVEVAYSNKQNLIVAGLGGTDTVDIAGAINLPGILEINAEEFTNTSSSLITADTLFLNSVNTAGLSGQRILTNVTNLRLAGVTGDVFITENNTVDISELATTALFDLLVSAGDVTDSTGMVSNNTFNITANSGSIILDSANQLTGELSLSAPNGNITLNNTDTLLATVDAQDLSIISNSINNTVASQINVTNSTMLAANGQDIVLNAVGHRFTDLTVSNTANLTLVDSSALTINSVNVTGNADITAAGNVQLNSIRAGNSATVTTTAAIIDANGSAANVTANKVKLRAASGIGSGDAIETITSELDVINSGAGSSLVKITNTGNVLLTNLVNSGDIDFRNDADVTIDHVDAGFTVGTFLFDVANGSVFGVDRGSSGFLSTPDIIADTAFVTVNNGDFGTFARPIVLKLNSEFFLASNISNPIYFPEPPPIVNDTSTIKRSFFDQLNSASGQRLIEIESIADIDPAIFTDLHNYHQENISIRLPRDQMFDDELENYDRL